MISAYTFRRVAAGRSCSKEFAMKVNKLGTLLTAIMLMAIVGCASTAQRARKDAIEQAKPIRSEPERRPGWVDIPPREPLSFTGTSLRMSTVALSRNDAMESGRRQFVDFIGVEMVNKARSYAASFGIANEVLSPQIASQELLERYSHNISQALIAREFFTEVYLDDKLREAYLVYCLMQIDDKAFVARIINNYGKDQAAEYAKKAQAEQDAARRLQLEKARDFFGNDLSSTLGF